MLDYNSTHHVDNTINLVKLGAVCRKTEPKTENDLDHKEMGAMIIHYLI